MSNAEKFYIDVSLVHRLINSQFPQWAHLPIKPVEFGGWDNRTFHLGENMTVRLPSDAEYAPSVEKEQYWLPKLASLLPLPIPTPLALGMPTEEYPWHWSVYQWLDGETASKGRIDDLSQFAMDLAQFITAFQKIDATGGPHNFYRGSSLLSQYDAETRQSIVLLDNKIDTEAATAVWNRALASTWKSNPVWFHGDVAVGNMLVQNGQLSALIDFGSIGVGDPACDLAIAWTLFKGESREVFRANLSLDNATWERGRGWALWKALIVCAELPGTNPLEIEKSWLVINEVLADYKRQNLIK
jgi:aminoglycoside phosphotransferase (APT) family kinase protein